MRNLLYYIFSLGLLSLPLLVHAQEFPGESESLTSYYFNPDKPCTIEVTYYEDGATIYLQTMEFGGYFFSVSFQNNGAVIVPSSEESGDFKPYADGRRLSFTANPSDLMIEEPDGPVIEKLDFQLQGTYPEISKDEYISVLQERVRWEEKRFEKLFAQANDRLDPADFSLLQQQHADWQERAKNEAGFSAGLTSDQELNSPEYWRHLLGSHRAWRDFLFARVGEGISDELPGVYIDGSGGQLTILDKPSTEGAFPFGILVVRGPSAHIGEVNGSAAMGDSGLAVFTDQDKEAIQSMDGKVCKLTFDLSIPRLINVEEENCHYYQGMRAYFTGQYYKLGEVPE